MQNTSQVRTASISNEKKKMYQTAKTVIAYTISTKINTPETIIAKTVTFNGIPAEARKEEIN